MRVAFVKTVIENKVVFSLFTLKPTLGTISMLMTSLICFPLTSQLFISFYSCLSIGFISTKTPSTLFKVSVFHQLSLSASVICLFSGAFLCVFWYWIIKLCSFYQKEHWQWSTYWLLVVWLVDLAKVLLPVVLVFSSKLVAFELLLLRLVCVCVCVCVYIYF